MNHSGVISLAQSIDTYGSIVLSQEYTPFIDAYLNHSKNDPNDINYFIQHGLNATFSTSFGISIIKKDNMYSLVGGRFIKTNKLVNLFLQKVFEHCYKACYVYINTLRYDKNLSIDVELSTHFPDKTSYVLRFAEKVYELYCANKKYSLMVFNASDKKKEKILLYIQSVLLMNNKGATIWDNVDLTKPNFDLRDCVIKRVSSDVPSIGIYHNILDVYRDAIEEKDQDVLRHSINKVTLCATFDKLGDTAGCISILFCDCTKEELNQKAKKWNEEYKNVSIESFYRDGRVNGEVSFDNPKHSITLYNKYSEENYIFQRLATNSDDYMPNIIDADIKISI